MSDLCECMMSNVGVVFRQMADLVANFNNSMRNGGETFSHADGFSQNTTSP